MVISVNLPDGTWQQFEHEKYPKQWARVYYNGLKWIVEGFYDSEHDAAKQFQRFTTYAIRTVK